MPPSFYNLGDQAIYSAGNFFIPQERYRAAPFNMSTPTAPDDPAAAGIPAVYQARGGDDIRGYESFTPDFTRRGVFADPKEYGPGGMYEINPAALGFEFGPQGQVMRAGPRDYMQGQLSPSSTNPQILSSNLDLQMNRVAGIPLREIADMYDERMQMEPNTGIGSKFRNFMKKFTGAQSNFEAARVPGMLEQMAGKIPSLTGILTALGGNRDRSDRSRFAVDNAGYGQGTGRDQFGVFTGGKTLFGDTANYTERMQNEIAEIAKNFGYSEEDLMGLDPDTLAALGQRNKFRQTQVIDYFNKLRAKNLEAKYQKELEAKQAAAAEAERQRVAQVQSRLDSGTYVDRDDSGLSASDRAVGGGAKGRAANIDDDRSTGTSQGYTQHYMDGGIVDMLEIYD